jgi:hypothetical protein
MRKPNKAVALGTEFVFNSFELETDINIEHHPKEFEWVHSPDEYGGISIPIPVDPNDTKPVVVGEKTTVEFLGVKGFPFKKALCQETSGLVPLSIDIRVYFEGREILLEDTVFTGLPAFPQSESKVDRMVGDVGSVKVL